MDYTQIALGLIALVGSVLGGLMGQTLTNHRLDNIEKTLEHFKSMETRVTEHEIKIKHLEKTVFKKGGVDD